MTSFHGKLQANLQDFDHDHVIHPYGMLSLASSEVFPEVVSGQGCRLTLSDGRRVIDGLSSWWACVHGFRRKELDEALLRQSMQHMSHVMFGGLTHRPACELVAKILDLMPTSNEEERQMDKVFLCDSGSVAVEVAMKMALQYWASQGGTIVRHRFLTTRSGYHGDTFLPMSVSDPENGMHHLFQGVLKQQAFVPAPQCSENGCRETCHCETLAETEKALSQSPCDIAGVILEPIFQGAGAMRIYSPALLRALRDICDKYGVPLILDEIATGFGRTGEMFACNHSNVVPDIMCIGKALTGGYVTMGATIVSKRIAKGITTPLMHGPTFMANPLACAVSCASIDLLVASPWQERVMSIERIFKRELSRLQDDFPHTVVDVRVLGAIGIIEFKELLSLPLKRQMTETLLAHGVWLRPFANFLYTMPPFNAPMSEDDVVQVCLAMKQVVRVMDESQDKISKHKAAGQGPITFV